MKTIEFGEDRLDDLDSLVREMWEDEGDPRSTSYVRRLERPHIHWDRVCAWTLTPLVLLAVLVGLARSLGFPWSVCLLGGLALGMVYILVCLKRGIIGIIRIYQRYAPESLRNKCRFEPSCSQYMLLSLEKYGLVKGLQKGVDRLRRCNIHGGGFDEP